MPWVEPKFAPGIVKDRTTLSAQPGWVDGQWVRFKGRWPESIGGWQAFALSALGAAARAVHTWTLRDGTKRCAIGTQAGLYVIDEAGTVTNITPGLGYAAYWPSATFAFVDNQLYVTVTVPAGHGLSTGDILTTAAWGNGPGSAIINGTVTRVSDTVATVTCVDPNATSTSTLSNVQYYGTIGSFEDWSLDNFGQNLVALRKNGALYEWDPLGTATNLVSGGFGSALWTLGDWTLAGSEVTLSSGSNKPLILAAGTLTAGTRYRVTYSIKSASGTGTLYLYFDDGAGGNIAIGPASFLQNTTQDQGTTRTFDFIAPNNESLKFVGSYVSGSAITLQAFTIATVDDAAAIGEAPNKSKFMFVDSNRIIVLLGTVDEADVYNDLNVRWSGQANSAEWTPDTTNLSRSYPVQEGSTFVGAVRSRGQNLLFTDTGVLTMAFTGDLATVFSILPLAGNCGLIGPHAVVESNGDVFWLSSNNNFYRFQGGKPDPIRCEIRKDVTEHIEPDYKSRCFAWLNATFQEVWWHYPDTRDEAEECSRYAMVSVPSIDGDVTVWSSGTSDRTAGNGSTNFDYPILADASGNVFFHENGYTADGSDLESFVRSAFFTSSTGTNLFRMKRIIPDFREQEGAIIFTGYGKMFPNSPEFQLRQPTPCVPERQKVDVRWTSRLFAIEMSSTKRWELGYLQFEAEDSGAQR